MDINNSLTISIIIINRSRVERDYIVSMFNKSNDFDAKGYACIREALENLDKNIRSLVIIPLESKSFFSVVSEITSSYNNVLVVASGVELKNEVIVRCAEVGVKGYIELEASVETWIPTVVSTMNGEVDNSKIAGILLQHIAQGKTNTNSKKLSWRVSEDVEQSAKRVGLTPRERQIVSLIDKGLSNKAIAKELSVESNTVKNHVHSILNKYGVRHRGEAAAMFRKKTG